LSKKENISNVLTEITQRDLVSQKRFGGKYDTGHRRFMHILGSNLNINDKMRLSLSAYAATI
jgi:hypothetical protein